MPWNPDYYPVSMKNLPPEVRRKAIEIANALLEAGRPEGQAIRIAIARAKQWALRHDASAMAVDPGQSNSRHRG
jgi:uncharacterized protein YdaT